jgi:hypothetical protein
MSDREMIRSSGCVSFVLGETALVTECVGLFYTLTLSVVASWFSLRDSR